MIKVQEPSVVALAQSHLRATTTLSMMAAQRRHFRRGLIIITVILLLIATSRIIRLQTMEMDVDEVWSIWQTFGTPQQIIQWTPYDWPPLYYLLLGGWKALVGIHPFVVHLLSVFVFMLAVSLFYRVMHKIYGQTAAVFGTLAYAGLGYMVYISVMVRGYVFLMALIPLALWLAVKYFERPVIWRAVALAVCMAIMFYIHVTSVFAFIMIGLFTLILYPRLIWRWMLPGLILGILLLPELAQKISLVVDQSRLNIVAKIPLPPMDQALGSLLSDYAGYLIASWGILFIVATIAILYRWGLQKRTLALIPWLLAPVVMYLIYPLVGTFNPRHLHWIMVGLCLWLGWGLATFLDFLPRLPRLGMIIGSALLVVALFWPIPASYAIPGPPLMANFEALAKNIRAGDAVLIDPNCKEATPEEWDYYTRAYFPQGLHFVNSPEGYRRVWYVVKEGSLDPYINQAVINGRVQQMFVGPWNFQFRLYEAPPDPQGILFENGLRFHGMDVIDQAAPSSGPLVRRAGESIQLRLWWSIDKTLERDYSISTRIAWDQDKHLVMQFDGPPQVNTADAPRETSRWVPGRYYLEERELTLPYPTTNGAYSLYLTVYQWWDNQRIAAPGVDSDTLLRLQSLTVKAW